MKTCFKCHQTFSLDEFYAHPRMKDGYLNKCKTCTKLDALLHRAANLDRCHDYDRRRFQENPARRAANIARNKARNRRIPHKAKARQCVSRAKRSVLKPKPCEVCGTEPAQAHHTDYSKPLDVTWLCSRCHGAAHRKYDYDKLEGARRMRDLSAALK